MRLAQISILQAFALGLLLTSATLSSNADVAYAQGTVEKNRNLPRPGESDDIAAARINEEGKALVQQGKYYAALEKFRAALKLFPISNAIFNVGSMLYTLKHYDEAFPYLEQTLRAPLDPRQRAAVLKYRSEVLRALRLSHKDVLVRTNPPGAKLTLNTKALPYPAPTRILVPYGAADLTVSYAGFKKKTIVIQSSTQKPPVDITVRLDREEPYAKISARCPRGSDVFIDGQMRGFELVRTKMLIGEHVVRCGKTSKNEPFERKIEVRKGLANAFDFSKATK